MRSKAPEFSTIPIAVVIPAYRVSSQIQEVIQGLPSWIRHIIVVEDASPDDTAAKVQQLMAHDARLILIRHTQNQGVGGAMQSGFRKALELGAEIIVKMDGDGQMDPSYLPALIRPLIEGRADYTKGNRFHDFRALQKMPWPRRLGNIALSFLVKAATGYWHLFDPANGYIAIRSHVLQMLPFESLDRGYYFETSMLGSLYLIGACVMDVPIPARYGDEISSLKIHRIFWEFPPRLLKTFLRRLILKNFLYDFSMLSVYLLTAFPLLLFGIVFGSLKWIKYASLGIPAPTGTVMLPTLCVILGIQLLLSAIEIDLQNVPRTPLSPPLEQNHDTGGQ